MELSPDSNELTAWLRRLEARAPASRIELGLDRVRSVFETLPIAIKVPTITVAGTNGKGSVVTLIESMLIAAGYRTLAYTSPHLLRFSERMRIEGQAADELDIVAALEAVEQARGDIDLTYFEHTTLAALWLASASDVDAVVLEVGLGGRLDAVNVVDADVAVITSIGIDHTEFLGETRDEIAAEKAGVARANRPVIVGDPDPPVGLQRALDSIGARIHHVDDHLVASKPGLTLRFDDEQLALPRPSLQGEWQRANAACAVLALRMLSDRLPVSPEAMADGLRSARLPGRFECVRERPQVILDVAHNPAAAAVLARALGAPSGRSTAVFSALAGKDVAGIGRALDACFTHWLVAPLGGDRGQSADAIDRELARAPVSGRRETVESLSAALAKALAASGDNDRVVVFGSFHTVAEAWPERAETGHS